jgi:hypothetical protein
MQDPFTIASPSTGKDYTFTLRRMTRTDYREFMNPETRYERVYYQVDVFDLFGSHINFGFVNDENDTLAIKSAVLEVIGWAETPEKVLESMHSRFD